MDWALLERSQQSFTSRQRFPVDPRHKAPVRLSGIHFVGQVVAKEGIHQPGTRRKHACQDRPGVTLVLALRTSG